MPLYRVLTTTSVGEGDARTSSRISPRPGSTNQNAREPSPTMGSNSGGLRNELQSQPTDMVAQGWRLPDAPLRASVVTTQALGLIAVLAMASTMRAGLPLGAWYPLKASAIFALVMLITIGFVRERHP